ncbi:WecB/TagA/CpsF family glycosyltransferase [Kineococcus auxinigenes]|uniref:WecB/TagA/CpsF family glycosyltransferase n=1 Tax=unclassified Kineococcus TaxID=2621656 RepID=UPI003D7CCD98
MDDVAFDALREEEVVEHVFDALDRGDGGSIVTPNVDILRQLRRPETRQITEQAELVVPDGMPIVWASRLQGEELPERVTGSSLIWSLSREAAATGRSVYLLGGAEGIAERAAGNLVEKVGGLEVAGWDCPPLGFEHRPEQLEATVDAVAEAKPDLAFVALGFPKQERLMQQLRRQLPGTWFVGCGGTLTMVAGEVSRAPIWAQRSGLEWVYRLAKEPRRMAKRYLVHDMPYAAGLMVRSAARRRTENRAA